MNPRALEEADERDRERRLRRVRGPLHGIPIALKDNIHTTNMPTTGGALAFAGLIPPYEATLTKNLRDAGAIIIAKTTMTELANWVAAAMPTNYNSLSGFAFNPYDPRRDPRDATGDGRPVLATGGSSSGIGTAMSFWAANVGTETSGSILSPSNQNMLVGIKPTVGRVSRYGVIPDCRRSGHAWSDGALGRRRRDHARRAGRRHARSQRRGDEHVHAAAAARLHEVPASRRTERGAPRHPARVLLRRRGHTGRARIERRAERRAEAGHDRRRSPRCARKGATVVDPADIPSIVTTDPARSLLKWGVCSGPDDAKGRDEDCSVVFKYGMKRDFNAWLASLGDRAPVKSLTALREWNRAHQSAGTLKYGQAQLDNSDEMDLTADRARYEADRAKDLALSRGEGIDAVMKTHKLDALIFPGGSGAAIAAKAGYPTVIVPFGTVPNSASGCPPDSTRSRHPSASPSPAAPAASRG